MTPEVAKAVYQFFDQDALKVYVEDRIEELHKMLEISQNNNEIFHIQGKIFELRHLLKAKRDAEAILKQVKKV